MVTKRDEQCSYKKITTAHLVNLIYNFCQLIVYGRVDEADNTRGFFPYQSQPSKRIIRSLLENDGEELTIIQSRQSGKTEEVGGTIAGCFILIPILANMPMFANDSRLVKYKNSFPIGIFAPTEHQAKIMFNRIKDFISSDNAIAIMEDPEINVCFTTNNGENFVIQFLNLGITSSIMCKSASEGSKIDGSSFMLIVIDEAQDVGDYKYNRAISPMGAFYNATKVLIGTPSKVRGFYLNAIERNKRDYVDKIRGRNHFEADCNQVLKYNPNYAKYLEGEKRRLGEDSDEYRMSYLLHWILERGMFVTSEKLESLGANYDRIDCDFVNDCIAGIDLGKTKDSTVVTIARVDWENPIIIEKSKNDDASAEDFTVYDVYIINWLEIHGDDWELQYKEIMTFLRNYKLKKIVMDATGVGASIFSRVRANMACEVEGYIFSTPSKSDLYKNYATYIRLGNIHYPNSDSAKETIEHSNFVKQHLVVQKSYSKQYLVVAAPSNDKKAHDDYPDSSALVVWGATKGIVESPQTEENLLRTVVRTNVMTTKNRLTGKRR